MDISRRGLLDSYFAEWDSAGRKFLLKPRYTTSGQGTTPVFGLGNATIQLNVGHISSIDRILKQITGESENTKLLPVDTTPLNRWEVAVASIENISKSVKGFRGTTSTIRYPEAQGFGFYHYENNVGVLPNGRITRPMFQGDVTNFAQTPEGLSGVQGSVTTTERDGHVLWDRDTCVATVKNGVVDVYGCDLYGVFFKLHSIGSVGDAIPVEVAALKGTRDIGSSDYAVKVRFNDGTVRKYRITTRDDAPVQVGNALYGVARITSNGEYYATSNYYKAGAGNTATAQFLSNHMDQNFIMSVIEGQYADGFIVAEEGKIRVISPSGTSKTFTGSTPIVKVFFSSGGDFIVTGTAGNYVMHQIVDGGGIEISCEDCGFISLYQGKITDVVCGGTSDAPPVAGDLKSYSKWSFNSAGWSGTGGTGSVVGGGEDQGWWHLNPNIEGGYIPFMEAPYYVVDGQTHILLCSSAGYPFYGAGVLTGEEAIVTHETGHAALDTVYNEDPNNKINISAVDAKYFISGHTNHIFFNYGNNPRKLYTPETLNELYWVQ